ncbi:ACP phosphodiesterase [Flavobacterium aquatile]|uniref:ACP phosphodiesterase n=1 Tax=Flavobacterium aquatile LMG 4008 = ATCC 11947 TaxID=1453498 RepID=A0A095SQ42_9FLAO|nr:acyl carrier protein phosphodiesterase [Flavobacterium aquatile]KGD66781.1 ACP phosphodiesterase [Flavobacterium aquatile LMG 4008 = ATCC 11947]OXA67878.1 ACP phosphodiesterase [Flavobacterium aquatile] [Flavobacterium aquatile LMG 4008 = ATCC 11947]GEC78717.1 ACP phosphodiesterase [Flavobacterium aquatile]
MNFLAHIYLSGNNDMLKIGNFMADSIRGHHYLDYPDDIRKGILLHRYIDTFTDAHPIYRKSKHRLHEKYGHYSGVIMDIVYDHYLAKNWSKYSNEKLEDYADSFYKLLQDNCEILTDKIQKMMPSMIARNWLVSYATLDGLEMILFQMDYRTKHRVHMQEAIVEVKQFYTEFEEEFTLYFEELEQHCQEKLTEL